MITTEERERKDANREADRWYKLGGIVFDVALMLESFARINGKSLPEYDREKLATAQRMGMLVGNQALQTVLSALNDEQLKWHIAAQEN